MMSVPGELTPEFERAEEDLRALMLQHTQSVPILQMVGLVADNLGRLIYLADDYSAAGVALLAHNGIAQGIAEAKAAVDEDAPDAPADVPDVPSY